MRATTRPAPYHLVVTVDPMRIGFRRLADEDLPMLHRWLNEPGVVTWWEGDDVTWDGVLARYSNAATADDSVEHHVVELDGRPVGWVQVWFLCDEPEMSEWVGFGFHPTRTAGIDYLVGEPADRGSGLGSAMLAAFVERIVFGAHPWIDAAGSDPDERNSASVGALRQAGFRPVGTVSAAKEPGVTYSVMRRDR